MRHHVTITIIFIFWTAFVYGNGTREYIATKQGITIISGGSFDSLESQKTLNNFLDFLLQKINRPDNQIKIIIQTCGFGFSRLKDDKTNEFIFVAYDTLFKRDSIYFEKSELTINQKIYHLPSTQNWMYSLWYPYFTIDSIYSKKDLGLIIKYIGYSPSINFYDRLIEIVNYSLTNIEKIKTAQRYYLIPYNLNKGGFVSLLSFDTSSLNNIQIKNHGFDHSLLSTKKNHIWVWIISIFVGLILIYFLVRRKKNYS